jgi:flagellar basal body P-ring formation protein FlgA
MHKKLARVIRAMRCCIAVLLASFASAVHGAEALHSSILPVPALTLYPGDVITDQVLADHDFSSDPLISKMVGAGTRTDLVGKVARRTLLPGLPIPVNAVGAPTIVSNGAKVRMLFEDGSLRITALGTALQSGSAGDTITVRNISSGLTVSGTVQADGSVYVDGG